MFSNKLAASFYPAPFSRNRAYFDMCTSQYHCFLIAESFSIVAWSSIGERSRNWALCSLSLMMDQTILKSRNWRNYDIYFWMIVPHFEIPCSNYLFKFLSKFLLLQCFLNFSAFHLGVLLFWFNRTQKFLLVMKHLCFYFAEWNISAILCNICVL